MTTVACTHCGATVPPGLVRADAAEQFCCDGCRTVYAILHQSGAGDFYRLRERGGVLRPEACQVPASRGEIAAADAYDDPDFLQRQVRTQADGSAICDWYVGGVHCAACVWLLERLPELGQRLDLHGVHSARLDFGLNRLSLRYDPERCTPRQQAAAIIRLGYRPVPWRGGDREASAARERRDLLLRTLVAGGCAAATMHMGLYLIAGEATGDQDPALATFFGWASCLAALPAVAFSARPYLRGARAAARLRRITIDTNIAAVVVFGYAVSLVQVLRGSTELYFDAVAMFVCFLLGARLVLHWARERVTRNMDAMRHLLPGRARRLADANDDVGTVVPVGSLRAGDTVLVERGDQLPCDGVVLDRPLTVDAALLSGEARPVVLDPGSPAHAGTVCLSQRARLAVTAAGEDTRMGALLAQVRGAGGERPFGGAVERLNAWFAPVVAVLAIATGLLWWYREPTRAWDQVVALVLAACPCAIGLAAPLSYALATGRAVRHGILLRDAGVIERLAHLRHAIFDKTGTLTAGRMQVVDWSWIGDAAGDRHAAVQAGVLALESRSAHPIALAITDHLRAASVEPCAVVDCAVAARGVVGIVPGLGRLQVGAPGYVTLSSEGRHAHGSGDLRSQSSRLCSSIASPARTSEPPRRVVPAESPVDTSLVQVGLDGQVVAQVLLSDPPRTDLMPVLADLRRRGVDLAVCSGDASEVTRSVAARFAIADASGGMSPEAKAERVRSLRPTGAVLMIGDGINDAPALAEADVAIGVRGGLQAAMDCSHVFFDRDDTSLLGVLLHGADAARRTINACLAVSVLYNLLAVIMVMIGWWGPLICAIAMPVSSLTVVLQVAASRAFATGLPRAD